VSGGKVLLDSALAYGTIITFQGKCLFRSILGGDIVDFVLSRVWQVSHNYFQT